MTRPKPTPDAALTQGRTQAVLVLSLIFVLSVTPTVSAWLRGDVQNAGPRLMGFLVSAFVLWQVYRGSRLALYVTLLITVLFGMLGLLITPLAGLSARTAAAMLAEIVFILCGVILYAHPPVKAFLSAQGKTGGRS